MSELLAVTLITVLAVISPGADFALVTRNSYLYGRKIGLLTSIGIGAGVQIHVLYAMLGVALLMATQPLLLTALKAVGAIYLIYLGYQTFTSPAVRVSEDSQQVNISPRQAFNMGLLTNALNPKTTLFVLSIYSQIVQPSTPLWRQYAYGVWMSAAHWLWFAGISVFFSTPALRAKMLAQQRRINRGIGVILASLGGMLALSSWAH